MSVVLSTHSVSLDGYMARTGRPAGRLNAWLFGSDERQPLHLSDESREVFDALVTRIVSVIFGEGVRFLDDFEDGPIRLERMRLVDTPAVAHVSFRVLRN